LLIPSHGFLGLASIPYKNTFELLRLSGFWATTFLPTLGGIKLELEEAVTKNPYIPDGSYLTM
jgi:hypothetical protein